MKAIVFILNLLLAVSATWGAAADPSALVKVRSLLFDIASDRTVAVEGVGTLILVPSDGAEPGARMFVLTAGHVASGLRLQVIRADLAPLKVVGVTHNTQSDLALIEVEASSPFVEPLASYLRGPDREYRLYTQLIKPLLQPHQSVYFLNPASSLRYQALFVDSGHLPLGEPPETFQAMSSFLRAPWLPEMGSMSLLLNREWQPVVSRSANPVEFELQFRFPHGFSGSPLLIHHWHGTGMSRASYYSISGILTASASNPQNQRSQVAGPLAIQHLIQQAVARSGPAKEPTSEVGLWWLFDGTFLRWSQILEVFLHTGPIGNGLVIEGFDFENQQLNLKLDEKLPAALPLSRLRSILRKVVDQKTNPQDPPETSREAEQSGLRIQRQ